MPQCGQGSFPHRDAALLNPTRRSINRHLEKASARAAARCQILTREGQGYLPVQYGDSDALFVSGWRKCPCTPAPGQACCSKL